MTTDTQAWTDNDSQATAHIHLMTYPEYDLPPGDLARIVIDTDGEGVYIEFRPGLSVRDQLRVLARAAEQLQGCLSLDGRRLVRRHPVAVAA